MRFGRCREVVRERFKDRAAGGSRPREREGVRRREREGRRRQVGSRGQDEGLGRVCGEFRVWFSEQARSVAENVERDENDSLSWSRRS